MNVDNFVLELSCLKKAEPIGELLAMLTISDTIKFLVGGSNLSRIPLSAYQIVSYL